VQEMLQEALANEEIAVEQYQKILSLVEEDAFLYHEIRHLLVAELKGVNEVKTWLNAKK
jgi:bacterioferritin (cytochrome b1)